MLSLDDPPLTEATACGGCGHLIAGVAAATGPCPECGVGFDRRELILFGRTTHWDLTTVATVGATVVGVGSSLLTDGTGIGSRRWALAWVGAAVLVRLVAHTFRQPTPGPERLRVSSYGCAVYRQEGWMDQVAIAGRSWSQVDGVRVTPTRGDRWRIRCGGRRLFGRPVDVILTATPEQVAALRTFAARLGVRVVDR